MLIAIAVILLGLVCVPLGAGAAMALLSIFSLMRTVTG